MVFKIKSPHEKYKSEQSKDRPLQKEGRSGAMLCLPVTPAVCFVVMVEPENSVYNSMIKKGLTISMKFNKNI